MPSLLRLNRLLRPALAVTLALTSIGYAPPPALASPDVPALQTARSVRPVAPGLTLTSTDSVDAGGWLRTDALTADLGNGTKIDYLSPGAVAADATVRGMAAATKPVAAVNGDFFDINNSGAALGIGVHSGELVQSPTAGWSHAVGFTAAGIGRLVEVGFDGTLTSPSGDLALTQFNNIVARDGIGLFTSLWGTYTRQRAVDGATSVTEVSVVDGVVTSVGSAAGSGAIPAGTSILLGRDAGATALGRLAVGDRVSVAYHAKTSDDAGLYAAVGGNNILVKDGVPQTFDDTALAARSAIGFSADGTKMFILTVDGKQVNSAGVTLTQWAKQVASFGAYSALNIDGGGSSTLLAREPGSADLTLENSPSDGSERAVANGLGLYAPAGSGRLTGFWVAPKADPAAAPGADQVTLARPDRVFPGLTRALSADGYDETYGPAAGDPYWRTNIAHGWVSGGVFHALLPGETDVTAFRGTAKGTTHVTVLDPLVRIAPTADRIALSATGGTFGVVGYDRDGYSAPIEPADTKLDYDHSLFSVVPGADGMFTVTSLQATAAGLITVHVNGSTTSLAVTAGLTDVPVATFDDAAQWTFTQARASGSLSAAEGHTGQGLKLGYDFTQSTATRAAYANPPTQFTVAGQPQAFGMWIYGNGKGEWPALEFYDALGQSQILRGPYVTWTGWQYVEMAVPAGIAYPLKLRRFYVVETKAAAQYKGEVVIDDLVAKVPPSVDTPAAPHVVDPVVGMATRADWHFAVMSDAQFVARSPDSDIVANARRTLREIKASGADFVIIDGDLVDEASPADIAFAKTILDEELGSFPYYYVPGNHEVMGGPIANFQAVFGDTHRVFDHEGTRFITLDTSALTIRGSDPGQYAFLRTALDQAVADPSIKDVVLVEHVPPRDPTPGKGSQLNDRKEAGMVEKWLSELGKPATFIGGHVGTFHASHVDGVPYFINGNSGKNPATAPDDGGFTGWTLFGVTGGKLTAQVNPHVDTLAVTVAPVAPGQTVTVSGVITQPGGRIVPAAYPVACSWTSSSGVRIGPWWAARPGDVAAFDPATGELRGIRRGTGSLTLTVNGTSTTATVTVA